MEHETIDRIEQMVRHAAAVLVFVAGVQNIFGAMQAQWGTFLTLVSMLCVGAAARADIVRSLMPRHPKHFVILAAVCTVVLLITVMTCNLSAPSTVDARCADPFVQG
jgi:uncharacterized membrane protein YoaK (UPF0700 family)